VAEVAAQIAALQQVVAVLAGLELVELAVVLQQQMVLPER
jgi:hypothetical protein